MAVRRALARHLQLSSLRKQRPIATRRGDSAGTTTVRNDGDN